MDSDCGVMVVFMDFELVVWCWMMIFVTRFGYFGEFVLFEIFFMNMENCSSSVLEKLEEKKVFILFCGC